MTDIKLSADGDLEIVDGDMVIIDGPEAIRQHLNVRLAFFRGEWFLDPSLGVPYFERVLRKPLRQTVLASVFRDAILETPGVKALDRLEFDVDAATRRLTVSFTAITDSGTRIDGQQETEL